MELNNNVESLKNFSGYFVSMTFCNLCGSEDRTEWAKANPIIAYRCNACGLVYHDPQLSREGRDLFYASGYFELESNREDAVARDKMYRVEIDFLEKHAKGGKILDVGCGGGFLLNKFGPSWEKHGIEFSNVAAEHARTVFNLDVKAGEVNESSYPNNFFDVIVMRGVIEHMTDPMTMLKHMTPWLKPNGLLYITSTPNVESLCAELYREKWKLFTADHQLHFSKRTVLNLGKELGMNLLDTAYFYLETPYANEIEDYRKIIKDAELIARDKKNEVNSSPAFFANMLSMIFKKIS